MEALGARIASDEPLITSKVLPQLVELLQKLKDKTSANHSWNDAFGSPKFTVHNTLSDGHLLPITNVSVAKDGNV